MDAIAFRRELVFFLNGTRVTLNGDSLDPDTTLLSFIRSQPNLTGTKLGCGEGGCGACTVVIQSKHPISGQIQHLAVNACLAPLISVDGKQVITVEALGTSERPHALQERLWRLSGSQCGFCTPGIVMSVYAMLRDAAYRGQLAVDDVELKGVLDGNLCRCTGYAPILAAVKSFVGDYLNAKAVPFNFDAAGMPATSSSECCARKPAPEQVSTDLTVPNPTLKDAHEHNESAPPIDATAGAMGRTAPVSGSSTNAVQDHPVASTKKGCGRDDCCQLNGSGGGGGAASGGKASKPARAFPLFEFKPYEPGTELIFPAALARHEMAPLRFGSDERTWFRPTTLEQLLEIKHAMPDAKMVGGSSEVQIEVGIGGRRYPACVYVSDIPELYAPLEFLGESFSFGGNWPLAELEDRCNELLGSAEHTAARGQLKAIRDQLRYFAGRQIRNTASIGGNIATASPISDLNPVWVATGAHIVAASKARGEFTLPMREFFTGYRKTLLPSDAVIVRVVVPTTTEPTCIRAYKQAKRKDDDIAIVTTCMSLSLDKDATISAACLAFGGMAAFTVSAPQTAAYLTGKSLSKDTLEGALDVLGAEFDLAYDVPGGMASYRRTLALSFLFKFLVTAASEFEIPLNGGYGDVRDITDSIHRGLSSATFDNEDPYRQSVVGQQLPHNSGLKHVTGEAIYVDDMPKVGNEAYAALVLSQRAHAKIVSVDASAALDAAGVIAYVDHRDLPNERANYWGTAAYDEQFFATDEVVSHGQIIGAIVASDKIVATKAARLVKVEYEDLPTILTIEEALAAGSFHPQYDRRIARGQEVDDALAACDHVLEGVTRMGGQEHFYLETGAALVVPKLEGGEMEVFSSTQALAETQHWVAQVTGAPRNRIVARGKRLGGGFGGKESRTAMLAAVCAVSAKKLRRPIRSMLDRDVDIRTSGQRHPTRAEWKVGFTKEGKLQALKCDVYINGGYSLDLSGGVADRAIAHLDNAYYIPHFDARARICKTNTVSNTAFRGFGGPQGMVVAEHFLEEIAHFLQKPVDDLRTLNLYLEGQKTPYHQPVLDWHVPRMLEECRREAQYDRRRAEAAQFNKEHRWRKRGLALVPTKFGLAFGVKAMNQGSALVHIYMDGSVLVAHGGTEMGQGLYTKCTQIAAQELGVPHEAIFTSESSTATVPNTVPTAASAGSDLQGHAVHNACVELNRRLAPFRERLGPDATLASLAAAAWGDRVSLSATGHYVPESLGYVWRSHADGGGRDDDGKVGNLFLYFTQGVAMSEVELDLLTGDHTILRTDIKMDVGRSLNPAIDYGQILGAFTQGFGWSTMEESLWLKSGAIFTAGPGAYKIPGFSDIPQHVNISMLKNVEWPNQKSIHSSKGIGEPPLFLGVSVPLALRDALRSARADAGLASLPEFRLPMTSERLRLASGDFLACRGAVEPVQGKQPFFVHI